MNNPLEILKVFDLHQEEPTELTLFGRSALALGYPNPPSDYAATHDVDVILPSAQLELLRERPSFWLAQQATNRELEARGLYMTHIFSEYDIIIQPDWVTRRAVVPAPLNKVALFRPATIDLILTKMARGDADDLADVEFLLSREALAVSELQATFSKARVPDVSELKELFRNAQPKVLAIAEKMRKQGAT
ncbi:MAG: hypothetical protein L0Y58_07255 [Verrucomicrobia subdivision 3 bacterium]|nr:hypothetical protein [Limisphaerales bacterium]